MPSFLRGVASLVDDGLAWWWGLRVFLGAVVLAVVIAPDAPGPAIVVAGILCLLVAIVVLTPYFGTLRARERYERSLLEHDEGPDDDAGPE